MNAEERTPAAIADRSRASRIVDRINTEARAGAPDSIVLVYAAQEALHASVEHDGDASQCQQCANVLHAAISMLRSNPSATMPADTELLAKGAEALMDCAKAAMTVQPTLTEPYPDDPRWSPWTRWMEPRARRAHDLAVEIRKHLTETGRRAPGSSRSAAGPNPTNPGGTSSAAPAGGGPSPAPPPRSGAQPAHTTTRRERTTS